MVRLWRFVEVGGLWSSVRGLWAVGVGGRGGWL